ncbi:hppfamily protein [Rhodotorula toruloides]|uniref:Hppfamily protein n=1 Tax=Rhodotorula toruloides TaxID=5286 RepID=A0A511K881_RHOTO|nr:hppfamily protein [Rhodotorula toruloides]
MATPAFPPPIQPAPVSRLTDTRESSLSPSRSSPAAAGAYSHSRGTAQRAYWVDGGGGRVPSEKVGTEGTASEWRDSDRSLSRDGSTAPLFRGSLHGQPALGGEHDAAMDKPNGLEKVKSKELLERERIEREIERERIQKEKKVRHEWRKHKARWFIRLARHFVGVRGHKGLPTPLIRPLRHLSPAYENYLLGFLGSFPSILIACAISSGLSRISNSAFSSTPLTVGSFGATAVLLYAVPEAPLSQPRNLVGGHVISAIVGAVVSQLFALSNRFTMDESTVDNTVAAIGSWHSLTPVSAALSVGLAVFAMQITGTIHPPGGATALIAAYHQQAGPRYTYILDVFLSITAMGIWSCFVGNLGRRRYPV